MGLGLDQFLNHGEGGGKRKFLSKWKDDGSIVVFLSTRADPAYPSWVHPFQMRDTIKDKDDPDKEIEILRFVRFVSPDPEIVHMSQFFRNEGDDRMKFPPRLDPFLKLREWLRFECSAPNDAVVFRWEAPQRDGGIKIIQWRKGPLARLVERGGADFGHTLDTKLEYLFVVINADKPGDGPQITRESRSLGDKMKAVIKAEMESNGEQGNPLIHPYAFKWKFDNDKKPDAKYSAARFNAATLTPAIREAIMATEFPDPTIDTKPRAGDKAKIRAAMEEAAQIDLPWDHLFPDSWKDEDPATSFPFGENAKGGEEKPKTSGRTPDVSTSKPTEKPATAPSSAGETTGPKTRRKKVEPPPPPKEELIACDDCGHMMSPKATKCPQCGAEYEVEGDPDPQPPPKTQSKPQTTAAAKPAAEGEKKAPEKCWSCSSKNLVGGVCQDCGMDQADDLPYG